MVLGFNHNVRYKGDIFHIQTEDSGRSNPHIITLLYRGGTILSSRKTSYADILKIENLEAVVEELMKEQHKDMLRRLKAGEFDDKAFPDGLPKAPTAPGAGQEEAEILEAAEVATVEEPAAPSAQAATAPPSPTSFRQPTGDPAPKSGARSLDEIILDYFASADK